MRIAAIGLALALSATACGPQAVRTDRVRVFDVPGKPESEWGYDPKLIEVASGTSVTFTNSGVVAHTVTSDGAQRTFDVQVDPGAQATVRFDVPGLWTYHCGIHPAMKGTVKVCDGACR